MPTDVEQQLRQYAASLNQATEPITAAEATAQKRQTSNVPVMPVVVPVDAGRRRSGWTVALACAAACVITVAGLAALTSRTTNDSREQQARTTDATPAANNPSALPSPPLELTEQQHADAVNSCAEGDTPTSAIVDGRTSGVLVGLTIDDTWRTCLSPNSSGENGAGIIIGDTFSPAESAPLSLIPATNPYWPISVIDAKAPDGNDIDGNEMTWVWGRIDPSIATVTIATPSARYTPTIHDGMFAASWPDNDGDRMVVTGFDAAGNEVAFTDQLNCAAPEQVETPDGLHTPMQPRVVVRGEYAGGGCVGGADVPPGQSPDDFGD